MPRRRTKPLLGLLAFAVLGTSAFLARSDPQQPTAPDSAAPRLAAARAIGTVHAWLSPDGRDVAFSYQGSIWRLPSAGGAARRLAAGPGYAVHPCWSPDGRRIAFLQGRPWGNGVVRVIDAQTGAAVAVPKEVQGSGKIAFLPDGNALLGNFRSGPQPDAFRALHLATGTLKTVVRKPSPRQPWALSRDGRWLAGVTTLDVPEQQTGDNGPEVDLWKAPIGGGEPERIVRFPARVHHLCWSADGRALYLNTDLGGVHEDLYRLDLDRPERPVKLTFGQADEYRPSVSDDGRWLLYCDNHAGCVGLVLRELPTGDERPVGVERLDFGVPTGRLRLKLSDRKTGEPLIARVSVEQRGGGSHSPPGSLWRVHQGLADFFADGTTEFDMPAGTYRVRAFHGPEYRAADVEVEVAAGRTAELAVVLERWTDPGARNWYAGDNHIHGNYGYGEYYNSPATLLETCAGEGLSICNLMVANSEGDGVFDREYFRGRPDPRSTPATVLYWNEEFRSTLWGHMTLVNLRRLVEPIYTGFRDTTHPWDVPPMSAIADRTHGQGGVVNYTHPALRVDDLYRGPYTAKGLPVYAALGQIDTMDVMGVNDVPSTALYHRLLNCGFRLTASAGNDCFLNRVPDRLPGNRRVYVKTDGPLSYDRWIAGLKAGRSFVTNGPVLDLQVDGKGIGDRLALAGPADVRVHAEAASLYPLERIELLYNGRVVATVPPAGDGRPATLETKVRVDRSGWVALHASGPPQPGVEGEHVAAHTSPVYVAVADRPAGSAEDARYFLEWIDRLAAAVEERDRIPDQRSRTEVRAELEQAREVYRKILERESGKR